jgi:hypothetical protein
MEVCVRHPDPPPTSRRRRLRAAAAAGLLAAALVAGCGGEEAERAAAEQTPADIEDQLGFSQSGIMARQTRVEASIRDCMKAQGFDYIPIDPYAERAALTGSSRLSDEDFLKQFGYGISTLWGRGNPAADPNFRFRSGLPPADRRAYDRALWGENKGATFTEAVDSGNFDKLGGCTRKATQAVFGGAQVLTQLTRRLDLMEEQMLEDQRMVRAIEKWSECITRRGYRYEEPEAIDEDLFERMEALVGPLPSQFATGPAPGETAPSFDRAALAELQREEVAIARADLACEVEHIEPVEEAVAKEYQSRFRDQNRALISQVKPVPEVRAP